MLREIIGGCMIALGVPAAGPEKKVLTEEDLSHILS